MSKRPLAAIALAIVAFCLIGCDAVDSFKNRFAHSEAVSASLEKALGEKPFVGFNWNNGSLTSVTVTFEGVPKDRTLAEIADLSRAAVLKEFKQDTWHTLDIFPSLSSPNCSLRR